MGHSHQAVHTHKHYKQTNLFTTATFGVQKPQEEIK